MIRLVIWKHVRKTITDWNKNIISVQLQGLLTPARRKRNPIYDKFYQNTPKVFFIFKMNKMKRHNLWNEHLNGNLNLMDHSVIFTQICTKLHLYIKWAKIKPVPELSTFQIPEIKVASETDHFVILPKLTQNFFQFQMSKIEIPKISKIKIRI